MTPTGRLYSDYHARVLEIVHTVLQHHNICFDLIQPGDKIDTKSDCLLVVWSEDCLCSKEKTNMFFFREHCCQEFIDQLSSCHRPVIWLTAVDRADLDFERIGANIQFLHYGGDMMFGMNQYPLIAPQRAKSFDNEYVSQWVSLSHAPRTQRIVSACCLLGHDLGNITSPLNRGLLRISNHTIIAYESLREYVRDVEQDSLSWSHSQDQVLQEGFVKLKKNLHNGQPADWIYDGLDGLANAVNFDRSLRSLYQNSLVEIVNETTFFSKGIFVTEKFQNSVYGFNLPIILSNTGTVGYLRSHGFDLCDTVIDHGYDNIDNPVDRIFAAIEKNFRLLTDFDYAKYCHQQCLPALEQNYQYARQGMYWHFLNHFRQKLQDYLASHCDDA